METKLKRIAEAARMRPDEKFTSLAHLINEETIKECHREMERNKASGVDEVTKEEYELKLEGNAKDLISRMKRQAYKPQPARRVYIPKPGTDKKRPLGIPTVSANYTKVQYPFGKCHNYTSISSIMWSEI